MVDRTSPEPTSHYFRSQRLRLHYVDWGTPGKPPLILLHGGRDHCRSWDWIAARLCHEWHVVAPDLRGHGDSAWADGGGYGFAALVYDLAALLDHLGVEQAVLVGHSLGGNVAVRYSGIYPERVRKLVSIEGLGLTARDLALREEAIAGRLQAWMAQQRTLDGRERRRYPSLEAAAQRMQAQNPRLTPEQVRHLTRHGSRQEADGHYRWKFDEHVRARPPCDLTVAEIRALWSRIACPTLLVHGQESWAPDPHADGRAAYFRQARVESLEGAGHWVHLDREEAFLERLQGFLTDGETEQG